MTRLLATVLALGALSLPASAAAPRPVVTARHAVTIDGVVTTPDLAGCGSRASTGCDEHAFAVDAKAGSWVTVSVPDWRPMARLVVRSADGLVAAESGDSLVVPHDSVAQAVDGSVTFRQPRSGVVDYVVGLSAADPGVATEPWAYRAVARLGGRGWDREANCFQIEPDVVPPVPADLTKRLRLAVTVLTTPDLAADVRAGLPDLVAAYDALNVALRVRVETMRLPSDGSSDGLLAAAKARFGGERPAGSDVVYVASDYFAGGYADCLGGVRFAERAFAVGQVHYTAQGVPAPGNGVRMGHIAAHEIGHLLGAHHEHSNCAEAEPEAAQAGAPGPCTVMSPAGMTGSGEWSTVEAAYVRYYVEHFAKG